MPFPLFTTIPPHSDFRPFVENWVASGFKVTSINCSEEAKELRTAGIDVLEVDSDQKRLRISEIMRSIAQTGVPLAGFINADCRFITSMDTKAIESLVKGSIVLLERVDVNEKGGATTVLSLGYDAFLFDTTTLNSLPDADYRIGMPWWDYWFPLVMEKSGLALKRFSCPVLLHTAHQLNWDNDSFLKAGQALQAEFPAIRIMESNGPNPLPTFCYLSRAETASPPDINIATAALFSSIPALIRDIHGLQQDIGALRHVKQQLQDDSVRRIKEIEALRQEVDVLRSSLSYRITHLKRLASSKLDQLYKSYRR